jgi:hypothetical protein
MNTQFEANKLRRQLDRSGKTYDFFRLQKNNFGEPDREADAEKVGTVLGLYHEINYHVKLAPHETATVRQTPGRPIKQPSLLCLYESVTECKLQFGDYTIINGKTYKVVGVTNVQEWNIIADISLEVVDDGNHVLL